MSRPRSLKKCHWCFTSYLAVLPVDFDKKEVRYCVYQREVCPDTKRQHFQGYIEFFDGKRVGQVKAVLGECHLEVRRGSRTEARDYCFKDETAVSGSRVEFGLWRADVSRKRKLADILLTEMTLSQLKVQEPIMYVRYHRGLEKLYAWRRSEEALKFRQVKVTVLIGPTGCGKTRKATSGNDWFMLPLSDKMWFDGYNFQSTLVIDDFYGGIKYSNLLRILDGYALQLPIKGGFVHALWTNVIITSNAEVCNWYKKLGFTPPLRRRITEIVHMVMPGQDEHIWSGLSFID